MSRTERTAVSNPTRYVTRSLRVKAMVLPTRKEEGLDSQGKTRIKKEIDPF